MITLGMLRKVDPEVTTYLTDEELEAIRKSFYDFGQLMFDDWQEQKISSKNPVGLLSIATKEGTL